MTARLAILLLAAGIMLQPLLALAHGTDDCCAAPDATLAAGPGADDHECCCCESEDATGESAPAERERPDQRPRGCDCPKSCCTGIVKVPLGVSPAHAASERRYPVEQIFSDAPEPAGDAWTSRLKRPPRAFAAV